MRKKFLTQPVLYGKAHLRFSRNSLLSILILLTTVTANAASDLPDPTELLSCPSAPVTKSDVNTVNFPAAAVDITNKPKLNAGLVQTVSAYLIRDFNEQ